MGYLPKHVKVRRLKAQELLIATAVLRGASFGKTTQYAGRGGSPFWYIPGACWASSKWRCAERYHYHSDRTGIARGPLPDGARE